MVAHRYCQLCKTNSSDIYLMLGIQQQAEKTDHLPFAFASLHLVDTRFAVKKDVSTVYISSSMLITSLLLAVYPAMPSGCSL